MQFQYKSTTMTSHHTTSTSCLLLSGVFSVRFQIPTCKSTSSKIPHCVHSILRSVWRDVQNKTVPEQQYWTLVTQVNWSESRRNKRRQWSWKEALIVQQVLPRERWNWRRRSRVLRDGWDFGLFTALLKPTGPPCVLAKVDFNQLQKILSGMPTFLSPQVYLLHFSFVLSLHKYKTTPFNCQQCEFLEPPSFYTMWMANQMTYPVGPAAESKDKEKKERTEELVLSSFFFFFFSNCFVQLS